MFVRYMSDLMMNDSFDEGVHIDFHGLHCISRYLSRNKLSNAI